MAYPIEYLNLYDKEGNLVNEKGIRGVPSNYLKGIVIIYIENSKGEFLIQKTSKSRGSVFATTGGHVDYGDTFDSTIIKEVSEELGIDISKDNVIEVKSFIYDTDIRKVYYLKKDIDIKDIKSVSLFPYVENGKLLSYDYDISFEYDLRQAIGKYNNYVELLKEETEQDIER